MDDCYCDYEPPEVFSETYHKARKTHRCGECGCMIQPGETYERAFGIWDGYPSTHKTCSRCLDLRRWVAGNIPCFCWCYGQMISDARECIGDAQARAPEETKGLRFAFLRRTLAIHRHSKASRQERKAA